jgi:hypothetical protein
MKNLLVIIIGIVLFASCTPEAIELDVPQAPQKIIVASQQMEGNYFVVVLSRSFSALEQKNTNLQDPTKPLPEELLVKNAIVELQLNGSTVQLFEASPGVYGTEELFPQFYETYTLKVTDAEKQEHVIAQTQMLPKVPLDDFSVTSVTGKKNQYTLSYSFNDLPEINNWYVVNFYTKDNAKDSTPENPRDIDYIAKRLLEQRLDFDLISEKDLVQGKYQVTKTFSSNDLDTFGIALSNISQGYYEFLAAQKKYASITNKIRGEVINMPTNIQNGYGYFNLHTPDLHAIRLKE